LVEEISHYCGSQVFLSFLERKKLWLTSLSQSNDSLEGAWVIKHWLSRFTPRTESERDLRKGYSVLLDEVKRSYVALGTCFSEEPDLLSQWRGYAENGAGFSLTFDLKKITGTSNHFGCKPSHITCANCLR